MVDGLSTGVEKTADRLALPGIAALGRQGKQVVIALAGQHLQARFSGLARFGRPEIFNTAQGRQFTSWEFTKVLSDAGVQISMDGKGAWRDNVVVERFWRTIKYEEVYIHADANVPEARAAIGRSILFFNSRRPHASLDGQTPDQAYFNQLPALTVAA